MSSFLVKTRVLLSVIGLGAFLVLLGAMVFAAVGSVMGLRLAWPMFYLLLLVEFLLFLGWSFHNILIEKESYKRYEVLGIIFSGIVAGLGFAGLYINFESYDWINALAVMLVGLGLMLLSLGWRGLQRSKEKIIWS